MLKTQTIFNKFHHELSHDKTRIWSLLFEHEHWPRNVAQESLRDVSFNVLHVQIIIENMLKIQIIICFFQRLAATVEAV